MSDLDKPDLTTLTVDLLAAYFANNVVPSEDLASLIQSTHGALAATANGPVEEAPAEQVYTPAVSIKKSLASPDHLISLIDGKSYKTLKRHLAKHGLTIAEYKERYKLPASYPSVAPSYSEARRQTATRLGLGGRKSNAAKAEQAAAAASAGLRDRSND